jgi:hypothetical protein
VGVLFTHRRRSVGPIGKRRRVKYHLTETVNVKFFDVEPSALTAWNEKLSWP